jgi:hypothetical protein
MEARLPLNNKIPIARFYNLLHKSNIVLLFLSIVLLRLPIAFGYRYDLLTRAFFLIPFLILLLFMLLYVKETKQKLLIDEKQRWFFILFILIWVIAFIRKATSEFNFDTFYFLGYLITWITFGGYVFLAFAITNNPSEKFALIKSTVYACGIYIALNLLFYFLGIRFEDIIYLSDYPAHILSLLGIVQNRVIFPMANGINSFGIVSGAALMVLIPLAVLSKNFVHRIIAGGMVMLGLLTIFLTDSRGALLVSLSLSFIIITFKKRYNILNWAIVAFTALSLFILFFTPQLLTLNLSWFNRPTKQSTIDVFVGSETCQNLLERSSGFLSNRPVIWEIIINELKHPKFVHLVGYGARGQTVSGLSDQYACLFVSYAQNSLASAHNVWLQLILDIGYIGLGITTILILKTTSKLIHVYQETNEPAFLSLFSFIGYIILIGIVESPISPDMDEIFYLFTHIVIISQFIYVSPYKT